MSVPESPQATLHWDAIPECLSGFRWQNTSVSIGGWVDAFFSALVVSDATESRHRSRHRCSVGDKGGVAGVRLEEDAVYFVLSDFMDTEMSE